MLKVGIAKVDYTPELGLPLMGNYRDDYAARGVHDPLYSKAMVIANSTGQKIALLSVDICMIDRDNISLMRESIASSCDIKPENILIAATHTHSGPAPMQLDSLPKADDATIEAFLKKAAEAVGLAEKDMAEANFAVGCGTEHRLSFNRRLKCKDGKTHMNWEIFAGDFDVDSVIEPWGSIDPEIVTLSVERAGKRQAAIVNFALHPAILAGDNWLYSADYPGYLAEALSKLNEQDIMTMFFNGCCGNANHIDYTDSLQGRGYQMTQRVGYMLAADAFEAMNNEVASHGEEIAVSHQKVSLKPLPITEEQKKWCEQVLKKAKNNPTAGKVDGMPDEYWANTWLEMYEKQYKDDQVEVMVIRVGDIGIVGLPGEIFSEFGLEIKKKSPAKHTLVFGLANDAIGYLPTKVSFEQGGYEPMAGSTMYVKGAGEKLTESAIDQLKKLFKK